jgi:hypothetical protein
MAKYIDGELMIEKMTRLRGCSCSYSDGIIDEVEDIMSDLPTADVIPIPEGATNGEVFMAMFKCMVIDISDGKVYLEGIFFPFDEEWWNAPYKAESEK